MHVLNLLTLKYVTMPTWILVRVNLLMGCSWQQSAAQTYVLHNKWVVRDIYNLVKYETAYN